MRLVGSARVECEDDPPAEEGNERHGETSDKVAGADNRPDVPGPYEIEATTEDGQ
jgi:hypothetical protein